MLSVCPDADRASSQASRVKLDERWRTTPTKMQKLCASLEAHMPASWPAEVRHSLLGRMRSVITDLWQSIRPAKVSQSCCARLHSSGQHGSGATFLRCDWQRAICRAACSSVA